jgi:NAD(P)-dependent dehydrogenase (short-subunit alcohol dehydrogenase family)
VSPPKVAVVTGAASGLGQALTIELARRGHDVVGGDLSVASMRETADAVTALGRRMVAVQADVRDPTQVADLAEAAIELGGRIDVWVNNAGVAVAGDVGDVPLEDWRWLLDINLMGVVHGLHVAVPVMRGQGFGGVLNVASAAGLISTPSMSAYNASKAAVVAITETLHAELVGTGVRATALCPTFFETNLLSTARTPDPSKLRAARSLMRRSAWKASDVAARSLDDLEAGRLYSVPMADGRWLWRLRRLAPQPFATWFARGAQKMAR